jgi:dephospho-CoA kinase
VTSVPMPVIIGLTGGIASGKSTVSGLFRELGAVVIDADALARDVVAPGQPALEDIRKVFGDDVLTESGELDRAGLAAIVFGNDDARARLEGITHPRIAEAMMTATQRAGEEGHRWVIYDAALIVEKGHHHWLDSVIVVAVSPSTQLERLRRRDGLNPEQAQARLDAQMPLADKIAVATFVIDNEGSVEQTRRQVVALHQTIDGRVRAHGSAREPHTTEPGP